MTLIDIFDDRYTPIGTAEKKQAHRDGAWHRTFSALAVNPRSRRIVLQKKAPGRYSFDRPDYADITVGGHYEAGETVADGVREVHEELGLPVAYTDLHPIGLRQTAVTLRPDYLEREFQHWHLLPLDVGVEEIPLADTEVAGLVEVDIDDAIALAEGTRTRVDARYATRTQTDSETTAGRADTAGLTYLDKTLGREELVPNYLRTDQLYLRTFIAARRYCAGERDYLYW